MTREIIELLHDKDRLCKKAKKSGKLQDWQMAKQIRNIANNTVKRAKINFIQDSAKRYEKDTNKIWGNINKLLPKDDCRGLNNLIDKTHDVVVESKDTAEFLNDYFTGIGPQLARAFDNTRYTQGERVPHRMNNIP